MCAECQEPAQTARKQSQFIGALSDIEVRLDALRSIASCTLESLPLPAEGCDMNYYVTEAGNLVAAMADIIDLCREDVKRAYKQLEEQLKAQ